MSLAVSREQRNDVIERWYDLIVGAYPAETEQFLRRQSDPFANPVGAALRSELAPIVDGIIAGNDPSELEPSLDRIVRVRALQDMSPAEAVGFVLRLKGVFTDVAGSASEETRNEFDRRVDAVLLAAVNVFSRCREQVYEIRVNEIRNRSLKVMERLNSWREARAGGSSSDT